MTIDVKRLVKDALVCTVAGYCAITAVAIIRWKTDQLMEEDGKYSEVL